MRFLLANWGTYFRMTPIVLSTIARTVWVTLPCNLTVIPREDHALRFATCKSVACMMFNDSQDGFFVQTYSMRENIRALISGKV